MKEIIKYTQEIIKLLKPDNNNNYNDKLEDIRQIKLLDAQAHCARALMTTKNHKNIVEGYHIYEKVLKKATTIYGEEAINTIRYYCYFAIFFIVKQDIELSMEIIQKLLNVKREYQLIERPQLDKVLGIFQLAASRYFYEYKSVLKKQNSIY